MMLHASKDAASSCAPPRRHRRSQWRSAHEVTGFFGEHREPFPFNLSRWPHLLFSPVFSSQRLFYLKRGRCYFLSAVDDTWSPGFAPPGLWLRGYPLHHQAGVFILSTPRSPPLVSVSSRIKNGHGE